MKNSLYFAFRFGAKKVASCRRSVCNLNFVLDFQFECIKEIRWNTSKVLCAVLSADDRRLCVGSADSTARVIDIETGNVLKVSQTRLNKVA